MPSEDEAFSSIPKGDRERVFHVLATLVERAMAEANLASRTVCAYGDPGTWDYYHAAKTLRDGVLDLEAKFKDASPPDRDLPREAIAHFFASVEIKAPDADPGGLRDLESLRQRLVRWVEEGLPETSPSL